MAQGRDGNAWGEEENLLPVSREMGYYGSELPAPRRVQAGCGCMNLIDIYWCLQCARLCSRHEKSNGEHVGRPAHVQELTVQLANL